MPDLICPKCQSPMRSYERNAVTVDQCTGCRGVFLDRGELERLVDAESAFYERAAPPPPPPPVSGPPPPQREPYREHRPEYRHGHGHGHHGKKRKKSFLDDIFDFG
ncbi:MAG TPA: zf-TFIIB domain-containing protein [Solirubrobacteraceae bacterium]|nr:zf-TFIIB domain-containing protein [Solirubrobacteraceae bacterium]